MATFDSLLAKPARFLRTQKLKPSALSISRARFNTFIPFDLVHILPSPRHFRLFFSPWLFQSGLHLKSGGFDSSDWPFTLIKRSVGLDDYLFVHLLVLLQNQFSSRPRASRPQFSFSPFFDLERHNPLHCYIFFLFFDAW